MKYGRKILAMCLAVMMIISMLPTTAWAADDTNPTFSVQYYAWLEKLATSGDASRSLPIIDTSAVANGGRATLPTNDLVAAQTNFRTKTIYMNDDGSIKMDTKLMKIYNDRSGFRYYSAPGVHYVDVVTHNNGNYDLKEIWVASSQSDAKNGNWSTKYTQNLDQIRFTNNSDTADDSTILITNGMVMRLVYAPATRSASFNTDFYDYDITDGTVGEGNVLNTYRQGINSESNAGSGSRLAFGNANTGMGWEDQTIGNGYEINIAGKNRLLYKSDTVERDIGSCAFGLASGMSGNNLYFNVAAPNLFGGSAGGVTGKYHEDGKMNFSNVGDTYTLSSATINGGSAEGASGLEYFSHPGSWGHIWTNHFWPMDGYTKSKDPEFGGDTAYYFKNGDNLDDLPASDDGQEHNSYFGLNFHVDFTMPADYVGPLNYLFFGDDDMWVYLYNHSTRSAQLICDIGGVHSSVGEFVNLRDYIGTPSQNTDYSLYFFYTERGASGSTCYMQFTLPQVHPVIPVDPRGSLKITKALVEGKGLSFNGHENDTFDFTLTLQNAPEMYSCEIYDPSTGSTTHRVFDGTQSFTFTLHDDGYALIKNLPAEGKHGDQVLQKAATYTVTEAADSSYHSTSSGAKGSISANATAEAKFTNTYKEGHLTVTKKAIGSGPDYGKLTDKKYSFTVKLTGESDSGLKAETFSGDYGDMTFTNGVATFTLTNGKSATAEYLPAGFGYEVTETPAAGFETTYTNEKGTIEHGKTAKAVVENRFRTGHLTVTKTVDADSPNYTDEEKARDFRFTVTLKDPTVNDTYGDMEFVNGVAEFTLKHGKSLTATDLPAGMGYTVTEEAASGYATTYTGAVGTVADKTTRTASFTNEYQTGQITVSKQVNGEGNYFKNKYKNEEFDFTVTLTGTSVGGLGVDVIDGKYGDMTFTDGVAKFQLRGGESITATGIPAGFSYTVEETKHPAFDTYVPANASGTVANNGDYKVDFINTYQAGSLVVSKSVPKIFSEDAKEDKKFHFTVKLTGQSASGLTPDEISGNFYTSDRSGAMNFVNGVAEFTLKDGESMFAMALPAGFGYEVIETANDYYVTTSTGSVGTIVHNNTHNAAFTNTRKTTDLVVSKIIDGNLSNKEDVFEFTITAELNGQKIDGIYGDIEFKNGEATVILGHEQSVTATGLPTGTVYTVTELDRGKYDAYINNKPISDEEEATAQGELEYGVTAEAAFTNVRRSTRPTDIEYPLQATKYFNDSRSKVPQFTFVLKDEDGNVLQTKHNDSSGTIRFDKIKYTADGEYTYTIEEVPGDDETITYDTRVYTAVVYIGNGLRTCRADYFDADGKDVGSAAFYNTADTETPTDPTGGASVTVTKKWVDSGEHPESVQAQLYKDDAPLGDSVTLSAANGWKHTWADLESGSYSVKEVEVPEGYTVSYSNSGNSWTITNTLGSIDVNEPENTPTPGPDPEIDIYEPEIPTRPLDDTPKTGDGTGIGLWFGLMLASLTGLVFAILPGKKGKNN